MRIAFTTTFDARDVHNWSGTPYHMARAFEQANTQVEYIGNLKRKLPRFFKIKQVFKKYFANQRESPRFNIYAAQHYSAAVNKQLENLNIDAVISPLINPIAYVNCKQPIILWTDALYAALLGFYEPFATHSTQTIQQGNAITRACLTRCARVIFSSDWAANSAIELYGISPEKVRVVPFGANIDFYPDKNTTLANISRRSHETIKLLFLAKSWERKGGNRVLQIAKHLHDHGHKVELTVVGYSPPNLNPVPSYVRSLGFISKHTLEGQEKIRTLLSQTHFLIVPSLAEAYGIVFCEANAFAVPCLTTHVGGIGTIIKDHVNGIKYSLDAPVEKYCTDILALMQDRKQYETLALSAYQEYESRLNWQVSVEKVKSIIQEIL